MKNLKLLSIAFVLLFASADTFAQILVRVRPARPRTVVVRRPPAPSPRAVWVEEDWAPSGNRYVWHGSYWAAPPRPRAVFISGHWRYNRRGSVWVPGHWR